VRGLILKHIGTSVILSSQGEDMERRTADEYPQELLDLFHEYQHGDMDRRTFMNSIGKFAVGGLTAAAIFESLKPNYAWAQTIKP
jgi:carboxymethylenebutenolidase